MRFEVTDGDTAAALGSGDLPVLGTPRLIAWMERVTVEAASSSLTESQTTVGTAVRIRHRRPTGVGQYVEITAELCESDGPGRLTFTVRATDGSNHDVAIGRIDRAVVDRDQFLSRVE